jgi:hypothetical protein
LNTSWLLYHAIYTTWLHSNISINISRLPMKISYLTFLHSISLTISMTFLFSKTWFYLYVYSDNREECEVANFHGQASDAYAYVWMVQGSLFSWITLCLWHMCHTLNRCKVAYFHGTLHDWDRSHDVFHKNKLPYICSMYDTGFKVLSMKINYLEPFKHKHKHQKFAHEN